MAKFVAVQDGDFSDPTTWGRVTNTPTLHSNTNVLVVSGTPQTTAAFTAPSTSDFALGVLVFDVPTPGTNILTFTLQEDSGGGFADVATVNFDRTAKAQGNLWVFAELAVPYQFTTAAADAYRWKIENSSGSNAIAQSTTAGSIAYMSVDSRTGAPGAGDEAFLVGPFFAEREVVVDTTGLALGNLAETTGTQARSLGHALYITSGKLLWAIDTDTELTCKGSIYMSALSFYEQGSVAAPVEEGVTSALLFDVDGSGGSCGLYLDNLATVSFHGAAREYWRTVPTGGVGTAADPVIFEDPVDWEVGDFLVFAPGSDNADNYSETEARYIITKNSATSYVLSSTSGGAEAALVEEHAGARVVLMTRNVEVRATVATLGTWVRNDSTLLLSARWMQMNRAGTGSGNHRHSFAIGGQAKCDLRYCTSYGVASSGSTSAFDVRNTKQPCYMEGCVITPQLSGEPNGGFNGFAFSNAANQTLEDCISIATRSAAVSISGSNYTLERPEIWASGMAGLNNGGIRHNGSFSVTVNHLRANAVFARVLYFAGNNADIVYEQPVFGDVATNGGEQFYISSVDTYQRILIARPTLQPGATEITTYLIMTEGSEVALSDVDGTINLNRVYKPNGVVSAAGPGLADTTARTDGNYSLRLAPETLAPGLRHEFYVRLRASSFGSAVGYLKKNATFGSDELTVEFYLPGSTEPDEMVVMPDDTEWNTFALGADYTGTEDNFARVVIRARSVAPGAYVYLADIFNGTNSITGFKAQRGALPSPTMFEQAGDAAAVWQLLTEGMTTPGTMGYNFALMLREVKNLPAMI